MSNPFVAEIRIFPFSFAPTGWAVCNGQLLPFSQNTALFSLLGTTYGGDGKSNFALPNLQGSAPMHPGQGPGLSLHDLGESGGVTAVTLLASEMAAHNHQVRAYVGPGLNSHVPDSGGGSALGASQGNFVYDNATDAPLTPLDPSAASPAGGDQPHNNLMPYMTFTFCIALQGVYPPRT